MTAGSGGATDDYVPRHLRDETSASRTRRLLVLGIFLFFCLSAVGTAASLAGGGSTVTSVRSVDYVVRSDGIDVSAVLEHHGEPARARVWYLLSAPDDDRPWIDPAYRSRAIEVELGDNDVEIEWSEPLPPSGEYRLSVWVHAHLDTDVRSVTSYQHAASWIGEESLTVSHDGLGRRSPPRGVIFIEAMDCNAAAKLQCAVTIMNDGEQSRRVLIDVGMKTSDQQVGQVIRTTPIVIAGRSASRSVHRYGARGLVRPFVRVRQFSTLVTLDEATLGGAIELEDATDQPPPQ